jgi:hypothetical protein
MVKEAPDYKGIVDRVHRPDIYRNWRRKWASRLPRGHEEGDLFDGVGLIPPTREYAKAAATAA